MQNFLLKVIIFDFDGVIINSNQIKYKAFFQIFPPHQQVKKIIKKALDKHRENSRYYIIEKILTALQGQRYLRVTNLNKSINFYANKYGRIVEKGAMRCKEIKGASQSLKILFKHFPLYINSTTPEDSLRRIILKRSLGIFFKGIYGGPKTKIENLSKIIEKEKINGREVLIVGDGQSDLEVARKFESHFIGIQNAFNRFNNSNCYVLKDLSNLPSFIMSKK